MAERAIEQVLGYRFARPELCREALTHPTWLNEHPGAGPSYERLEFLGDSVLGLLSSQALMRAYPHEQEGALSRRRAQLVRQDSLAALAASLGLAAHVRLGKGQQAAGAGDSILADVFEALLGAVFLDGGLGACERVFGARLAAASQASATSGHNVARRDAKTELQEMCHRQGLGAPRYDVVACEGPAHARTFTVRLSLPDGPLAAAVERGGPSKKKAEQACAEAVLAKAIAGRFALP